MPQPNEQRPGQKTRTPDGQMKRPVTQARQPAAQRPQGARPPAGSRPANHPGRPPVKSPQRPPKKGSSVFPALLLLLFSILLITVAVVYYRGQDQDPPKDTDADAITAAPPASSDVPGVTDDPNTTETPGTTEPPATTDPGTEPEPQDTVVKFAAAGDVLIHECVFLDAAKLAAGNGSYDFDPMFAGISSLIKNADLAFANMECPIAGNENGVRGYPNFNAPTESGDALVDLGFNVINIANNHMLDMDTITTGYLNTIRYWKTKNVLMIGGYESAADYDTVRTVTVDGITIAFLSYTYGTGTVGYVNSASPGLVIPKISDATIKKQIAQAKTAADLVFVSIHWGQDSAESVTNEQVRLGQLIADAGADVIIGTHSHTVQPMKWLTGKDGNKTLCIYSLGNLISTQLYKKLILENIVTFDIVRAADGTITIQNVVANPIVCHYETDTSQKDGQGFSLRHTVRLYPLEQYTEELCARHGAHNSYGTYKKNTESFTSASLASTFRSIIDGEFLPDWMK